MSFLSLGKPITNEHCEVCIISADGLEHLPERGSTNFCRGIGDLSHRAAIGRDFPRLLRPRRPQGTEAYFIAVYGASRADRAPG